MNIELRHFWKIFLSFNWKFGIFLIVLVCVPRFIFVLKANVSGNYSYIGIVMFISAIMPFIFLSKTGRRRIGMVRTQRMNVLGIAFIIGLVASVLIFIIGHTLYGNSYENWYSYIGRSYQIPNEITPKEKLKLFIIMALAGMTVSPIGEELFFRGMVQTSFAQSIGDKKASIVDSSAFALTHISHFGIVILDDQIKFLFVPALIWLVSMFLLSIILNQLKNQSASILGAIFCHSGFNLGMIYCIFYLM